MTKTQSSSTVGPIIFSDQTARSQLEKEGEVVTFRKTERTTGDTWWRQSRLGPKQGDVRVEEIGKVNPLNDEELSPYREKSGFETVSAWQTAIKQLNGSVPSEGYLYRVSVSR